MNEQSEGKSVTNDIFEQVNQCINVEKIKDDICGMKDDITRLDRTIEDLQRRNNKRFDKIEADIGSIKKMTKTITQDNSKILDILVNWNHQTCPKNIKVKSSTTIASSNSSHETKNK